MGTAPIRMQLSPRDHTSGPWGSHLPRLCFVSRGCVSPRRNDSCPDPLSLAASEMLGTKWAPRISPSPSASSAARRRRPDARMPAESASPAVERTLGHPRRTERLHPRRAAVLTGHRTTAATNRARGERPDNHFVLVTALADKAPAQRSLTHRSSSRKALAGRESAHALKSSGLGRISRRACHPSPAPSLRWLRMTPCQTFPLGASP
jgi:hypothetical protein